MKKLPLILLCFIILFGALGCANENSNDNLTEISNLSKENEPKQETEKQKKKIETSIWELVQLEVAENLKQPTTAEFDDISKVKFYKISNDTYEVLGSVKGQNALGNMVSNYFCATVIVDSKDNPTIVSNVEFLGESSYNEQLDLNEQLKGRMEIGQSYLTSDELSHQLTNQPLYVTATNYIDSNDLRYSSSSMIQAMLYNNSDVPIKSAVIAFVAWDKNKLPVKIKERIGDGVYFFKITFDQINLMPGDTYKGKDGDTYFGMEIDANLDISFLKATVVSYEDFDGNTWNNPLVLDFKNLYEEKRLLD